VIFNERIPFVFSNSEQIQAFVGPNDAVLKTMEAELEVQLTHRGDELLAQAEEERSVVLAKQVVGVLKQLVDRGAVLTERDATSAIQLARQDRVDELLELYDTVIHTNHKGKPLRAKTLGQARYVRGIEKCDLTFGIGPAGTGKTYLAVVMAAKALKEGYVKRLVLTRPAVEAGENLGFLPGDLKEKVDPYLRPLYDALHDVLGVEHTARLLERGVIEIAPLAYMRGRTLEHAFVILDEAQNTTREQMKMFLTRLGFHSKMIVTGDLTQVDLPRGKASGLQEALNLLGHVRGIHFEHFSSADVVRHPLVRKIIDAYSQELE